MKCTKLDLIYSSTEVGTGNILSAFQRTLLILHDLNVNLLSSMKNPPRTTVPNLECA